MFGNMQRQTNLFS
uniref:Uncharacterized protein n=1 Tax=Anguilla anguilla TaxID=7936 RepID=A0A0E9Q917_ANGAN